jgi:pimeloyl-ACP methyl ester carboxylesterase
MSTDSPLPTLVLVHGAGSAASDWRRVIDELGGRWAGRVLAPNLPGHGGEAGPGRASIDEYATWLEAWIASQVDGAVVLGGHSMGGAVALETALRGRVDLDGLILVSTGARLRVGPEVLAGLRDDFEASLDRLGEYAFSAGAAPELRQESSERARQAGQAVVEADFQACDGFDVMTRLREIDLPTLVLCGTDDRMTPPNYAQYLAMSVADGHLEMIEGVGHALLAERPAAVAEAIVRFLEEEVADEE